MATTTSTTRTASHQEPQVADVELHEPFQLSLGLAAVLCALVVTIVAIVSGPTEAAIALAAVAVIWLSGTIR